MGPGAELGPIGLVGITDTGPSIREDRMNTRNYLIVLVFVMIGKM